MNKQNEGNSELANKSAKEFAKWSSKEYKEEVAGEFGATVPTGYVAPNKLDEKTAQKYSGGPTATPTNRMTQETATELNPATKSKKTSKKNK